MKRLLLDTNMLVLWIAGQCDKTKIGKVRRLKNHTIEQYEWVDEFVVRAGAIVTLPNILSEAGNLLMKDSGDLIAGSAAALCGFLSIADELYMPSLDVAKKSYFLKLGLTDGAIISCCLENDATVLTADFKLHGVLTQLGGKSYNANHLLTP